MKNREISRTILRKQNKYGVKTPPFTMKDLSLSTLHSPNHNGGGAEPDFEILS